MSNIDRTFHISAGIKMTSGCSSLFEHKKIRNRLLTHGSITGWKMTWLICHRSGAATSNQLTIGLVSNYYQVAPCCCCCLGEWINWLMSFTLWAEWSTLDILWEINVSDKWQLIKWKTRDTAFVGCPNDYYWKMLMEEAISGETRISLEIIILSFFFFLNDHHHDDGSVGNNAPAYRILSNRKELRKL